jgi:hypothetical protein
MADKPFDSKDASLGNLDVNSSYWQTYTPHTKEIDMNEEKDPGILIEIFKVANGESLPAVGFEPKDFGKEFVFVFINGERRRARLISSNTHCSYDENGQPRNVLINLEFV